MICKETKVYCTQSLQFNKFCVSFASLQLFVFTSADRSACWYLAPFPLATGSDFKDLLISRRASGGSSHWDKMEELAVEVCGKNGAYYKVITFEFLKVPLRKQNNHVIYLASGLCAEYSPG